MITKRKQTRRRHKRDTATDVANKLGLAYLRKQIHAVFKRVFTGAIDAAIGVRHIYERDVLTRQWARATDPDAMAALLNLPRSGESEDRMVVYTQDPDVRLLKGLLAFQIGAPFDPELFPVLVQGVEVNAETGEMTVHINKAVLPQIRRPPGRDPQDARVTDPPPPPGKARCVH